MYDRSLDHLMQQVAAQPETKQVVIDKTINGCQYRIEIDIRLRRNATPHQTVYHGTIQDYYVLTLSAWIRYREAGSRQWKEHSAGQCHDTIRDLLYGVRPSLDELLDIWEGWHLNDMQAACIHQVGGAHVNPGSNQWIDEWDEMVAEQKARCPEHYSYGSQWLVNPLPPSILRWYVNLEGGE